MLLDKGAFARNLDEVKDLEDARIALLQSIQTEFAKMGAQKVGKIATDMRNALATNMPGHQTVASAVAASIAGAANLVGSFLDQAVGGTDSVQEVEGQVIAASQAFAEVLRQRQQIMAANRVRAALVQH